MNIEQVKRNEIKTALLKEQNRPDITLHLKNGKSLDVLKAKGESHNTFVLVLPGGGYELTYFTGGLPVAREFSKQGFDSAVLYYTTKYIEDVKVDGKGVIFDALIDVMYAIEAIRQSAEFKHHKIVIAGFSAGGHLASAACTMYDCDEVLSANAWQSNLKVDGAIMGYAVVTADEGKCHDGSFITLSGSDKREVWQRFSTEKLVREGTPPAFVWTTFDDALVPYDSSVLYAKAMWDKGNIAELEVFPVGVHGASLYTKDVDPEGNYEHVSAHNAVWFNQAVDFLKHFVCA